MMSATFIFFGLLSLYLYVALMFLGLSCSVTKSFSLEKVIEAFTWPIWFVYIWIEEMKK